MPSSILMPSSIAQVIEVARQAQRQWQKQMPKVRQRAIRQVAGLLAEEYASLLPLIPRPNASAADKIASEVFPLAEACRFTAAVSRRTLAPQTYSMREGAWWIGRVRVTVSAEPWGIVLIVAPGNYPLFLPGVQAIQALAAGNAVLIKPAPGCQPLLARFKELLIAAGVPTDLVHILPEEIAAGREAMQLGVDKVVATGSAATGQAILHDLATTLTPATLELSGCDAIFVLPQAQIEQVVPALIYALKLNGGATCIAPRRIFVTPAHRAELAQALDEGLSDAGEPDAVVPPSVLEHALQVVGAALSEGAEIVHGKLPAKPAAGKMRPLVLQSVTAKMAIARTDLFAPIVSIIEVPDMQTALAADRHCPYGLGAAIFGPRSLAEHWANEVNAGCVVINDAVVPTADPRVPFGGWGKSGWGLTRGREGLREMARTKTTCTRLGNWKPHLDRSISGNEVLMSSLLAVFHASSWRKRFQAMGRVLSQIRRPSPP
ncbi:aldehyde dehydrogenase family protein [Aureliella helgolandensis]|uniref:Phenylacetaldehyde dehydrogenase n=1 Tax=Aureliella helgolandensis TaxID=2527968 RepID=A0A518G3Y9_9BACT|nr:aldehyde dehydrogenase family protein [Aureliella helgolandensis]QDV23313.1 Phenylacetaldehyde dehydrogenase [Aureliella helgolandensis]